MSNANFLDTAKHSFTAAVYFEIGENLITNNDDHFVTRVAKITANFIAAPVFAVAMIAESIVRALLSIPAKLVHLFIPESHSGGFNEHVLDPLTKGSAVSAGYACGVLSTLVSNFFAEGEPKTKLFTLPLDMSFEVFNFLEAPVKYQFFK